MITENTLKNLLKHYLAREYKERGIEAMCISEYLPLCAALLYPYVDIIEYDDSKPEETTRPFVSDIKKFAKKRTDILATYSLQGLRLYLKQHWFDSEKREYLKCVSIISDIEEGGRFSIKCSDKVIETYLSLKNLPNVSEIYGNNEYNEKIKEEAIKESPKKVEPTKQKKGLGNISLEPLREFLHREFPEGLRPYSSGDKFFWERKMTGEQYSTLKKILLDLDLSNHIRLLKMEPDKGSGTVAMCVALYISEWYKRESGNLDGDGCLASINLREQYSSTVWRDSGLSNDLLHNEEGENQLWQIAMCVLGGFPIQYVHAYEDRFCELINKLSEAEKVSDENIDEIIACFDHRNKLFTRSLREGSCRKYLESLLQYLVNEDESHLPIHKDETDKEPFKSFIIKLREGYEGGLKKYFFRCNINLWTSEDSEDVESEFKVQIGLKKSKNIITIRQLRKLGITIPESAWYIRVKLKITTQDGSEYVSEKSRIFNRIGHGNPNFCGAFGSSICSDIDMFNTKRIDLLFEYEEDGVIKEHPYPLSAEYNYFERQYIELFNSDNSYMWSTETDNSSDKVVLYNPDKYDIDGGEENLSVCVKGNGNTCWKWIYLSDNITLIDKNNSQNRTTISIGTNKTIDVVFFNTMKNSIEFHHNRNRVEAVIDGEPAGDVPILYYQYSGKGRRSLMMSCDGERGVRIDNNQYFSIEYKPVHGQRYKEWGDGPQEGFINVRINKNDRRKKDWIGTVYFIPCKEPITRDFNNHCIKFQCDKVSPLTNYGHYDEHSKQYTDSLDSNVDALSIPFRIGNEENHIIINAYRPIHLRQIVKGNLVRTLTGNRKPLIADIFKKSMRLRIIDENGFKEQHLSAGGYRDYFVAPSDLAQISEDDICRSYVYLQSADSVKIEYTSNSITLSVSDDSAEQYRFCYWSGNRDDELKELKQEKVEDGPYKYDFPEIKYDEKALVFQSLNGCSPDYYFRPYYGPIRWSNYLNRYTSKPNVNNIIKSYQYAVEYNTYFFVFPALCALRQRYYFTTFIRGFIESRGFKLSNADIKNLIRLAKELAMDWFFVDKSTLLRDLDEEKKDLMRETMKRLLQKSPLIRDDGVSAVRFIELFLKRTERFNVRAGSLPRKFLCSLDKFIEDDETRIVLLNELINSDINIFSEINEIIRL